MEKQCKNCKETLPITDFYTSGKRGYRRSSCKVCRQKERKFEVTDATKAASKKKNLKVKQERRSGENRHKYILQDSRKSDRKNNRENDLTIEFIEMMISKPCSYCGAVDIKMTLDRIDNELGHLKSNVNPSCIRCNHIRGNMPMNAWEYLIPGLKAAHAAGAFGEWRMRPFSKKLNAQVYSVIVEVLCSV